MFAGEGAGLRAMHAACVVEDELLVLGLVLVHHGDPEVHFAGATPEGCRGGNSCIVMDHLDFGARGDQAAFGARAGEDAPRRAPRAGGER